MRVWRVLRGNRPLFVGNSSRKFRVTYSRVGCKVGLVVERVVRGRGRQDDSQGLSENVKINGKDVSSETLILKHGQHNPFKAFW